MRRIAFSIALLAALAVTSATLGAGFTVTSAGPDDSFGALGDSQNTVLFPTYSGPTYPCDVITVAGTLTKVNPSSLASDSTWSLHAFGGFNFYSQLTTVTNYTTLNVSDNTYGLFFIKNYPQYRFESGEMGTTVDQPGLDAQWTNVTFTFHPQVPTITYSSNPTMAVTANTLGSSFGTQLALYSSEGVLLGNDINSGPGGFSQLTSAPLDAGTYYLVAGGSSSTFLDNWGTPGAEFGNLQLQINDQTIFSGALESGHFNIIPINVVPEPSAVALAALGALLLAARFRRIW